MATSNDDTPYAVSPMEARFYYAGLPFKPTLVYRTGKPWSVPRNPWDQPRKKELRPVFNHPIVDLWSGVLSPEVVKILDTHQISFTAIDVVRFKSDGPVSDDEEDDIDADVDDNPKEAKEDIGPVTIWIGVFAGSTRLSATHNAARDILSLLARHQITDTDVDFRDSLYTHEAGPPTTATPTDDTPYAVSPMEARFYYAGLPSEPILIYRTGKPWSPPRNPEARPQKKELRPVFNHPIVDIWSGVLGPEVVKVLDSHQVLFTTIDVVRFKTLDGDKPASDADVNPKEANPAIGPVTIWIGVLPESTRPSVAHRAAQDVLSLLARHQITDSDVDFRESLYTHQAGPRLHRPVHDHHPLFDVISPLTPALGLPISTKARPAVQGTMGLYLDSGDDAHTLLGLSCRHVLLDPRDDAAYTSRPRAPLTDVILLGKGAYTGLVRSVRRRLGWYVRSVGYWEGKIQHLLECERGEDGAGAAGAAEVRVKTQALVDEAEEAKVRLGALLDELKTHWKKPDERVLGPVVCSPPIAFGVGSEQFTEDWAVFAVDRTKLGDGFKGNKLDLGSSKISAGEFILKCSPCGAANWSFRYPYDRLLPLRGILTDQLMRHPDMWDASGEPCLLVVQNGRATGATIGRANGVSSIVRHYLSDDMAVRGTSMEWGICNYDGTSESFSGAGDSGSVVADIRGRVGGLLAGGCGVAESSDMTYATPFWWLLPRIRAHGLPNISLDVD